MVNSSNSLAHYGVLGMKWGVRRYQNKDGSYTKRGLERYRKSEANYNASKQKLSTAKASGDRQAIKTAKVETKRAKNQMSKNYKQLKKDYVADQGKELYQKGKTISGNATKHQVLGVAITAGSAVAGKILSEKYGSQTAAAASAAIAVGGNAVNLILAAHGASQNKKLRAYYAH